MADIVLFKPKAELGAEANLKAFIQLCRDRLTIFGKDLAFDSNAWDVTQWMPIRGRGDGRQSIVFSSLSGVRTGKEDHIGPALLSFAKAYTRYMHGLRPMLAHNFRTTALRALDAAMGERNLPSVAKLDGAQFNRAEQLVSSSYSEGFAYRVGRQLQVLCVFINENGLVSRTFRWRSSLIRPGDTQRVGKEFDARRSAKLPSQAALDALPEIFLSATRTVDVLTASTAAILLGAPDRMAEVLGLPEDCEVPKAGKAYGLRFWPGKGADEMVKWIVPSMAAVVESAVAKIRAITAPARAIAKWYEEHPHEIYLPRRLAHLREGGGIPLEDLSQLVGTRWPGDWCCRNRVSIRDGLADLGHVERVVLGFLPESFPVLDPKTGLKYSEALFVLRRNETRPCMPGECAIEPWSINQLNSQLGNRARYGVASVFSRFAFTEPDGSQIRVTSNQFRHYLNSLAQAGGLSQLDIAKWSGRKDVRQNPAYDHLSADDLLELVRTAVGTDGRVVGALAELPKRVPMRRDQFLQLRIPTAHTTDVGACIHDYTMSPCPIHGDCLHCTDFGCIKGELASNDRLRRRRDEAQRLFDMAQDARQKGYAGSDRWLDHHTSTLERLDQLCSLLDDPTVPDGTFIQLAPRRQHALQAPGRVAPALAKG